MVESHRQEIAKLEALYASNPGGRVFVHLAEALRRAGEHERARTILEEGLARHPDSASGYVVLGRVRIDRGDTTEAEAAFRRVLELDSGNLVALRCLGDLARRGGRPAEATAHYRELIARNPASAGDTGLIRLLEDAQLRAAEAAAAAAEAAAAATRAEEAAEAAAAGAMDQPAAAAAATGEEEGGGAGREVEAPEGVAGWTAAADAALAPWESAAPGRTGPAVPAELEYETADLEALPGDLASFAGLAVPEPAGVVDEAEPEPRSLEDDVVVLIESSAAPLELTELEELAAVPAVANELPALPEPELPHPEQPSESMEAMPAGASALEPVGDAPADGHGLDMKTAGDMDVDAAMLDVGELSAVVPFEVVPEATELTLVGDDTVHVPARASDQPVEAAEVPAEVGEPVLAGEVVAERVGADSGAAGEDARTQDTTDASAVEAVETPVTEDLPWLVEPAEAAGLAVAGTSAGEEPAAEAAPHAGVFQSDAAEGAAEFEEFFAVPPHVAAEAEGRADRAPAWESSGEGETAAVDEAAADLAAAVEAEIETELTWTAEPVEPVLGFEPEPGFATFAEELEREADLPPSELGVDRDLARFAEDVEAEPELDTFMTSFEAGRNVAGFVADEEFTGYDPGAATGEPSTASFAEAVEGELHFGGDYFEDVEAEPDLGNVAGTPEAEPVSAGPVEYAWPEPGFTEPSEPAAAWSGQAVDAAWLDEESAGIEAAAVAPSSGPPEIDQSGPRAAGEAQSDELSREEERAATGGPEPTAVTVPLDAGAPTEPPWTAAVPESATAGADAGAGAADRGEPSPAAVAGAPTGRELGTETLADLYLSQGFAQRAAEVYRALLLQRPADDRVAAKLREAEAVLTAGRSADVGEEPTDVWLRGVEAAWTGGAGATGPETTPYTWTELEEREQGIGIGSYLQELLRWGTGEGVPTAELVGETAPATAEPTASDRGELAVAEEADTWVAAPEPAAVRDAGPEPVDWPPMTPEPMLAETWSARQPTGPWSEEQEEPVEPPEAWNSVSARGTAPNPVEEAFNEWFGPPPEPSAAAAGGVHGPATEPVAGEPSTAAGEDADDEDLEMFRAWLQSLKK
jgi:hypothetical protein